jgi:4-amino-4-deoxy-L-arabinose transferase and related glycosyltransferases of PMT family
MNPRNKILLVIVAFVVRVLVGWAATGHGEMEGLAHRYEQDAYAILAGYGFVRPVESAPPEVDLIGLAKMLDHEGRRISPESVPTITPDRWRPSGMHPPGYAYYLAAVYTLVGNHALFPVARLLQALVDALACLVLFSASRQLAGLRAARIAVWAYAFFLPAAYIATSRVADAFMPAASICVFALWVRALFSGRIWDFAIAGVLLGIASLLRPNFFIYPIFLGVVAIGAMRHARLRALAGSAFLGVAMLVVLLPWALHNCEVYGEFKFTTNGGGAALVQAVAQFPNPYNLSDLDEAYTKIAQAAGFDGIDDPAADRMFKKRYLEIARENPGLLVKQALLRSPQGLVPLYRWGYTNMYYYAGHSFYDYMRKEGLSAYQLLARRPLEVIRAYWDRLLFGIISFALLLTSVTVAYLERRRPWAVLVLFAPWMYMLVSHALINLGARLMVPVAFCQLIALGYLLARRMDPTNVELASFERTVRTKGRPHGEHLLSIVS